MPSTAGRLPPAVIQKWIKIKKEMPDSFDKMPKDLLSDKEKKKLKKAVEDLFDEFDSGLRKHMETASESEDEAKAKKALEQISKITAQYANKADKAVQDAVAKEVEDLSAVGPGIKACARSIKKALEDIDEAAASTLAAMGKKK